MAAVPEGRAVPCADALSAGPLLAVTVEVVDVRGAGANVRGVTKGVALGSAGTVNAASKLSAVSNYISPGAEGLYVGFINIDINPKTMTTTTMQCLRSLDFCM